MSLISDSQVELLIQKKDKRMRQLEELKARDTAKEFTLQIPILLQSQHGLPSLLQLPLPEKEATESLR